MPTRMLLLLAALAAGCSGSDGDDVDPTIELGFHRNGGYETLADGGTCWVADAIQGGYWVMPAVRTQGTSDEGEVTCTLADDQIGELGSETTYRIFSEVEGDSATLELKQFLLPLAAVDDPMFAQMPGRTGMLACSVRDDDGVELDIELDVVFDTEVSGPLEE